MNRASPFWTFSLDIYSRPGVPAACLKLQGEAGVDVNVLLFALFLADQGRRLQAAHIADIDAAIEGWRREAVVPLRGVRTFLKSPPPAFEHLPVEELRTRVKAVELEAERLQQEALFAMFPSSCTGEGALPGALTAQVNMEAYEAFLGAAFDASAADILIKALSGAA